MTNIAYRVPLLHIFHPVSERFKAWPEIIALLPALQHDSVPGKYITIQLSIFIEWTCMNNLVKKK